MSDPDEEPTVETPTLTDAQLLALLPQHPWEGAQERAMSQAVKGLLEPRDPEQEDTDGDE